MNSKNCFFFFRLSIVYMCVRSKQHSRIKSNVTSANDFIESIQNYDWKVYTVHCTATYIVCVVFFLSLFLSSIPYKMYAETCFKFVNIPSYWNSPMDFSIIGLHISRLGQRTNSNAWALHPFRSGFCEMRGAQMPNKWNMEHKFLNCNNLIYTK